MMSSIVLVLVCYTPVILDGSNVYKAHFECHDILMLDKNPIKLRQHPDMTMAADWDIKHELKIK